MAILDPYRTIKIKYMQFYLIIIKTLYGDNKGIVDNNIKVRKTLNNNLVTKYGKKYNGNEVMVVNEYN